MIGYIASLAGGFACVDRTGTIVIKWYEDNDVIYNLSRIMSFEKDEGEFKLEKLTCNVDSSTTYTAGDGLLGITLDNPFMLQAKLEKVYAKLKRFTYRGATIKTLGDIRLDPWDIITVEDGEDVYKIPVMNIVQEYDDGMSMTISSYSKTKTEEEIDFKGPSITEKERTYTEIQETKNLLAKKVDADYVNSHFTKTEELDATNAKIRRLETKKLDAEEAALKYANIDFSNIGKAAIEYFYATSGLIKNVTVGDQTITGELVGVTISGDLIEGNTIVADKLVIKGEDGLYYKLNTDGMTTETEQTDYNSINGQVIRAKSVTASKIDVKDLVAFDATIAGFKIEKTAMHSVGKDSATSTVRGIYLGKDGQMAVDDSKHYIKYYKDTDGLYKLAVSADSVEFSTGESVQEAINDLKNDLDNVRDEIVSIITISSSKGSVFKNTNVSTTLSVTIFRGTQRMGAVYGYLDLMQWNNYDDATAANTVEGEIYGLTNAVNNTDRDAEGNWVGYNYATAPDYYETTLAIINDFGLRVFNDYVWSVVNEADDTEDIEQPSEELDENVIDAIYRGEYGNGDERRQKLEAAGYNYADYQAAMEAKYYPKDDTPVESEEELAEETPQDAEERVAVVEPGGSFCQIAKDYLGDEGRAAELAEYNNMTLDTMLYAGMELRLPN